MLVTFLSFAIYFSCSEANTISMKFVEEPSSYSMNNHFINEAQGNTLQLRSAPSKFSGPRQFQAFVGKCFSKILGQYKYILCPFHNVTQFEQNLRWNPYQGVLGVWKEWKIQNNTFHAMMMTKGDSCGGSVDRSAQILFECGNKNEIIDVMEPEKCQYHITLMTPLTCHPDAMLVYPRLSVDLQKEWDEIEGQLHRDEITDKGYQKALHSIFITAGFHSQSEEMSNKTEASSLSSVNEKQQLAHPEDFSSLEQCSQEYRLLKRELDAIRMLLSLSEQQRVEKLVKT